LASERIFKQSLRQNGIRLLFVCLSFVLIFSSFAEAASQESIRAVFFPYQDGLPQQPGISPGMTIDQDNWQAAEPVLLPKILTLIQAGDFRIQIQETTDLPVRMPYLEASLENAQRVVLTDTGQVEHYQAGRPFPVLDASDPQAGLKALWNFRFRDLPQTLDIQAYVRGINSAGTVDRSNVGRMRMRFGTHRVGEEQNDAQWQEKGVYMKATFRLIEPADQEGQMRIMSVFDDDSQPQEIISYNPQNRRIRKSHSNLLARMGGGRYDILMEEQPPLYFIGYLHEYNWTYLEERVLLLPGFLQAAEVSFGGKNNWYPEAPWELRRVIAVECLPKGAHPYGKRIFYVDVQTYALLAVLSYDAQGQFARLTLNVHGHPDYVPGAQGIRMPIPLGITWVNVQRDDAAVFTAGAPRLNGPDSPHRFDLMELLRVGK
jgi:hypothetical protein